MCFCFLSWQQPSGGGPGPPLLCPQSQTGSRLRWARVWWFPAPSLLRLLTFSGQGGRGWRSKWSSEPGTPSSFFSAPLSTARTGVKPTWITWAGRPCLETRRTETARWRSKGSSRRMHGCLRSLWRRVATAVGERREASLWMSWVSPEVFDSSQDSLMSIIFMWAASLRSTFSLATNWIL